MSDDPRRDYRKNYYLANRERILRQAREYHYKNRDKYNAYSRQYWQDHKDSIVRKRKGTAASRPRANLTKPNSDPVLETRRKAYQEIVLNPPLPPPSPSPAFTMTKIVSDQPFIVTFD